MSTAALPPGHAEFVKGFEHHRAGRIAEAAALYQAAIGANPGHVDALHLLGTLKAQTGSPLIKAVVRVNGAVRKTLTGPALTAPIVLTKLSAKINSTVRLTLVDQERNQKFAKATYKPCRAKPAKKRADKKT